MMPSTAPARVRWPLAALLVTGLAASLQGSDALDDFAALDQQGRQHRLHACADVPVVVLYSYQLGCPIARQDVASLDRLAKDHNAKARVWLLDSTAGDDRARVAAEAKELGTTLPILLDPAQIIGPSLAFDRTGEALVIETRTWQVRWRGPVDDRLGYGAQKAEAIHRYLEDAIDAVIAGTAPATDAPASKGCKLTRVEPDRVYDYAKDIAPILETRCVSCHRAGGVAPWAMDSGKRIVDHAAMMRETIRTRRMPPWGIDAMPGVFENQTPLQPDEARALVRWIEAGAALDSKSGAAKDPLAKPLPAPQEWPLGKPDLIVECPAQEVPANGVQPYRRFEVATNLPKDAWVRAVDIHPSDRRAMHHAIAFVLAPGEAPDANKLSGLDDFLANYAPGMPPCVLPNNTGRFLPKGARISFQLHYTTYGKATTDHPRLGLYFLPAKPAREAKVVSARAMEFQIPPGIAEVPVQATWTARSAVTLYGLAPHMHLRGSWMTYEARYPDGKREQLLSVPAYDMNWQMFYRFAQPRQLPAGTTIVVDGAFDNSPGKESNPDPKKSVHWGEQSWDEMFIGYVLYAAQ